MNIQAKIEKLRAQVASLESDLFGELAKLPRKFGFSDVDSFADAVREAAGGRGSPKKAKGRKAKSGRKPRALVTDETRKQVARLALGGATAPEIAAALDLSVGTVHNIQKKLGLKSRRRVKTKSGRKPRVRAISDAQKQAANAMFEKDEEHAKIAKKLDLSLTSVVRLKKAWKASK